MMTDEHPSFAHADRAPRTHRLRWPLQAQLLGPSIALVLLTTCLATGLTAAWTVRRVRQEQAQRLEQTAATLAEATFPLTARVLEQSRALSGAEFVILDADHAIAQSTLELPAADARVVAARLADQGPGPFADSFELDCARGRYLARAARLARQPTGDATILVVLQPRDELTAQIRQSVLPAILAGGLAAIISSAIASWLARRFTLPIRELVRQTAAISVGRFAPLPTPDRNDEFRDLAESINAMARRLASYEREVRQHERLRSMGELAGAMAHQLRNTAAGTRIAVELHQRRCLTAESDESLAVVLRQLRLMESFLRQFLAVDNHEPIELRSVDFGEIVADAVELVAPLFAHADVRLDTSQIEPARLLGDRESLHQLATNLLLNALEAARVESATAAEVRVELAASGEETGNLIVEDTGAGVPAAIAPRLFQSFVTTKRNGVGLGLYCAQQAAQRHGGSLRYERVAGRTRFVFEFPRVSQEHGARLSC
ncbi:MAG: HAMP domain-containing histidine kinase [Pirellulales bacterium]|nr:HAMP domain-containing histidine kinase [Pirellulales bacterium]